MPVIQSVTVGDRVVDIYTFQGEVMDEKKWATTQVSGGGGGGYVHQGSGYVANAPVTSRTTTHDQFFVRSDDGQEKSVETANADLALRKGHRVTLLWGIEKGKERGPYVAVYNHTTNDAKLLDASIVELAVPPHKKQDILMILGLIVGLFSICFKGLGIVVIAVTIFFGWKMLRHRKELAATLRSAIESVIPQVKNQK